MPTVVTRSIGTAGGRDYSTIQAWEDAAPANLVTADQVWRGECYADSEFVGSGTRVTISGSTSSATCYKELTAATGQSFADAASKLLRYDASKGVALRNTNPYATCVVVNESYARLSRLQISSSAFTFNNDDGATQGIQVNDTILHRTSGGQNGAVAFVRRSSLRNCVVISTVSGDGLAFGYASGNSAVNVTVVRPTSVTASGAAFFADSGSTPLTNCAVFGFTNEVNNTGRFTASNCRTDKVSPMTGFSTLAYDASTASGFEVINSSSTHDFRLKSTSALIDAGTATGAPTTDIFGTTRPSGAGYDVGAHEYVSAATFKAFWARQSNVLIGITR